MTTPEPIKWLVDDRHSGKTTALMAWLVEGEARHHGRVWTRVVLTYAQQDAERLIRHYPGVGVLLGLAGFEGRVSDVILSVGDAGRMDRWRGMWNCVEFAIDDADVMLQRSLRLPARPVLAVASGTAVRAEVSSEEYGDLTTHRRQPRIEPEGEVPRVD